MRSCWTISSSRSWGRLGGIRYALAGYVSSWLYSGLHIPLTEFWILAFHAFLGTVLIPLTFLLGLKWGNGTTGILAAALVALNPNAIIASRWDNAESLVSVIVVLAFLLPCYRLNTAGLCFYAVIVAVCLSMESIIALPFLIVWLLRCWHKESAKRFIGLGAVIAITLSIHAATWWSVGRTSNLGLFGLAGLNYGTRLTFWSLPRVSIAVFSIYSHYFFYWWAWAATVLAALWLLYLWFWRLKPMSIHLKWSSLAAIYFFLAFILLPDTLIARPEHLYICESVMAIWIAAVWVNLARSSRMCGRSLRIAASEFFAIVIVGAFQEASARPVLVHPLKAVGYFVRHFGTPQTSVAGLWTCTQGQCLNYWMEYYAGKQVIDMNDPQNPRQLFCIGSASWQEIRQHYALKDFDFYVRIVKMYEQFPGGHRRYYPLGMDSTIEPGLHRVGLILNGNELLAEIYSRREMPMVTMQLAEYDGLWATQYANLANLLSGRYTGIVSMFGQHWSSERGY